MKSETYCSFNESRCTFEAREPLALALSILTHQLDEDIAESAGGDNVASEHNHVIVNHVSPWKAENPAERMKVKVKIKSFFFITVKKNSPSFAKWEKGNELTSTSDS